MAAIRYQNAGLFVLTAVLFGSVFVAIKAGLAALPAVFFAALRFDVAVPLLLAYTAWRYDAWLPRSRGDYVSVGVSAVTIIAANNAFLFLGQQRTTVAAASVMYALIPMIAPLFALVLLDERLDLLGSIGIALGLVGVVIIVQPSPATFTSGSTIGQLLVLGAAASVALGTVLVKRFDTTIGSIPLTTWAMAVGAVLLHGLSLALGESVSGTVLTPSVVVAVLFVGIASTAVAYPAFFSLIPRIGPVRTNLVAYLTPVIAALAGWVLLDQPATVATAVGFLVIVGGVALLERQIVVVELERLFRASTGDSPPTGRE